MLSPWGDVICTCGANNRATEGRPYIQITTKSPEPFGFGATGHRLPLSLRGRSPWQSPDTQERYGGRRRCAPISNGRITIDFTRRFLRFARNDRIGRLCVCLAWVVIDRGRQAQALALHGEKSPEPFGSGLLGFTSRGSGGGRWGRSRPPAPSCCRPRCGRRHPAAPAASGTARRPFRWACRCG